MDERTTEGYALLAERQAIPAAARQAQAQHGRVEFLVPADLPFAALQLRAGEDGGLAYRREIVRQLCLLSQVAPRLLLDRPMVEYFLLWGWMLLDQRRRPVDDATLARWALLLRQYKRRIQAGIDLAGAACVVSVREVGSSEAGRPA